MHYRNGLALMCRSIFLNLQENVSYKIRSFPVRCVRFVSINKQKEFLEIQ